MKRLHISVSLLALGLIPLAMALELPDPTRPPDSVLGAHAAATGMGASGDKLDGPGGVASDPRPRKAPPRPGRLSAVMLAHGGAGRAAAVIDGQLWRVGDKVDGGTLVAIDAAGVSLKVEGNRVVRLSLFDRAPETDAPAPQALAVTPNRTATAPVAALPDFSPAGARVPDKEQP